MKHARTERAFSGLYSTLIHFVETTFSTSQITRLLLFLKMLM